MKAYWFKIHNTKHINSILQIVLKMVRSQVMFCDKRHFISYFMKYNIRPVISLRGNPQSKADFAKLFFSNIKPTY